MESNTIVPTMRAAESGERVWPLAAMGEDPQHHPAGGGGGHVIPGHKVGESKNNLVCSPITSPVLLLWASIESMVSVILTLRC